ncbi:hypothetical protein M2137_002717 [Parabacteroides sp. PFB2-10]|uniref:glycoside hydrolase family 97 protein n=1 Tax=Parabacteroides sp. PFB2-10 TaxID=1742405 RepID=UPI00247309A2|nr:glycoside hydrolase family 97 protein [Parabacteroides sp. PFB2-10]MDH6313925.1 hypothetical protein [Parabacteroides sp. PFB2-10]
MNPLKTAVVICCVALLCACSQKKETISPNGKISVSVYVEPAADKAYGKAYFDVNYRVGQSEATLLSKVSLGLCTEQQRFADNLRLVSVSAPEAINESYEMITGKRSHCVNNAAERIYLFENEEKQTLKIAFRAYNDGVVFRYQLDETGTETAFVTEELTTYPIPDGTNRWMQQYANDYEGFFPLATNGESKGRRPSQLWGYPALIEPQDSLFVLITEANIRKGDSGSRLYNGDQSDQYQVRSPDEKIAFNKSFTSPWRVLIVGTLADVVESTLVTDVSEPSKVSDTNWIVPGAAAWIYWGHNHGSRDFQLVKEYIDLAAHMGWPYNLIDWEWDVMANGGTIQDALQYAREKGIKPLLWYNSGTSWIGPGAPGPLDRLNNKENREKEYAQLQEMGVSGIKIDFFAVDGAKMMAYYIDLLEDASKYKLMINFHGATIPRGWQRTYPHLMTVEAVYGAEWYNNLPILTERAAAHNATLPFTRNVIGSMDYTPGTFSDSQHPHITSHGHELALPVVFESALQHMPDRPDTYYALPDEVKTFLSGLPTAWDETKLLSGYPGEEVVMARRKGDVWYIGGLNGTNERRTLTFATHFLTESSKTITLIKDGQEERSFRIEAPAQITNRESVSVDCLSRGGFVAVIK